MHRLLVVKERLSAVLTKHVMAKFVPKDQRQQDERACEIPRCRESENEQMIM